MNRFRLSLMFGITLALGTLLGAYLAPNLQNFLLTGETDLISPFIKQEKPQPLLNYSIPNLATQTFESTGPINLAQPVKLDADFASQLIEFQTQGKKMTGLANIPIGQAPTQGWPVLIMVRGYVPPEIYEPGVGTKNAAEFFARQGFVTLAPDFLGYGGSDPDLTDSWESRFVKPVQLAELINTLKAESALKATNSSEVVKLDGTKLGIWAHSNGGQITLTTLEILQQPIPASLWAPVLAPFPYSLLYFSDENVDEGKATRNWIAQFERDYDVFDFSLTQHLDLLHGEFQLHHGTTDDSALKSWSDEFLDKVKKANETREKTDQIKFNYYAYPGGNHNLQSGWDTAIQRDLVYFKRLLKI